MSDLRFASEEEAMQYLANLMNKKIKVALSPKEKEAMGITDDIKDALQESDEITKDFMKAFALFNQGKMDDEKFYKLEETYQKLRDKNDARLDAMFEEQEDLLQEVTEEDAVAASDDKSVVVTFSSTNMALQSLSDVTGKRVMIAGNKEEYQAYFKKTLEEYGVESPEDLKDEDKAAFFKQIDKGWVSEEESKVAGDVKVAVDSSYYYSEMQKVKKEMIKEVVGDHNKDKLEKLKKKHDELKEKWKKESRKFEEKMKKALADAKKAVDDLDIEKFETIIEDNFKDSHYTDATIMKIQNIIDDNDIKLDEEGLYQAFVDALHAPLSFDDGDDDYFDGMN
jgi:hypothetical protein